MATTTGAERLVDCDVCDPQSAIVHTAVSPVDVVDFDTDLPQAQATHPTRQRSHLDMDVRDVRQLPPLPQEQQESQEYT